MSITSKNGYYSVRVFCQTFEEADALLEELYDFNMEIDVFERPHQAGDAFSIERLKDTFIGNVTGILIDVNVKDENIAVLLNMKYSTRAPC